MSIVSLGDTGPPPHILTQRGVEDLNRATTRNAEPEACRVIITILDSFSATNYSHDSM